MKYIDTHAHYDDEAFDCDRFDVIASLPENGVAAVINIGCDAVRAERSVGYAKRFPFVFCTVGIHPEYANTASDDDCKLIEALAGYEKNVAIGEIGLDYYYEGYDRTKQLELFERQLCLAERLGLPVVVHSRDAAEDTLAVLRRHAPISGVMHCFSGSAETAVQLQEIGMHISFTGVLTFKNARKAVEALKAVRTDRLLLETDCPYMAPEPHRGERCDSRMIKHVIDRIAEIRGCTAEEIISQTNENAMRLFRIKAEV